MIAAGMGWLVVPYIVGLVILGFAYGYWSERRMRNRRK